VTLRLKAGILYDRDIAAARARLLLIGQTLLVVVLELINDTGVLRLVELRGARTRVRAAVGDFDLKKIAVT